MPRIPLELYRSVIRDVDDSSTLYALLLASRDFYREAERQLYRNIEICGLPNRRKVSDETFAVCVERLKNRQEMLLRLAESPRIGAFLVNLDIDLLGLCVSIDRTLWLQFMPTIARICPHLKSLILPLYRADEFLPPTNACFQLSKFSTKSVLYITRRGGFYKQIGDFLESQPEIQDLGLFRDLDRRPPQFLPNLRKLSAPISTSSWLMAGRPVEELLVPHRKNADGPGRFGSHPYLKRLTLRTPPLERLSLFEDCFGRLEYLSVCIEHHAEVDELKSVLPQLMALSSLHVCTKELDGEVEYQDQNGQTLAIRPYLYRLNELLIDSRHEILEQCAALEDSELRFFLMEPPSDLGGG